MAGTTDSGADLQRTRVPTGLALPTGLARPAPVPPLYDDDLQVRESENHTNTGT